MPSPRQHWLNALPNFFWSALFLLPVYWFWMRHFSVPWLIAGAVASSPAYLLPKSVLRRLQLSRSECVYRQLGVPLVNRVTQDATWIRRSAGHPPVLQRSANAMAKLLSSTWERERFHLLLLLFFAASTVYAVTLRAWLWCGALTGANLAYNLYPIWLQQFVRLRLERLRPRG